MDAIETRIVQALRDEIGGDPKPGDSFTSLGLDSLRLAELARDLEDSFGIEVDQDLLDVETVAELAAYVRERMGD